MVQLSEEQRAALLQCPGEISCEDTITQRTYVLVEEAVHRRAMQALKQRQDLAAIRCGVVQMEAGGGIAVEDARRQLAQELGFSASGT